MTHPFPRLLPIALAAISLVAWSPATAVSTESRPDTRPRVAFGAYVPPAPESGMETVHQLESQIDHALDVVSFYQAWGGEAAALNLSAVEAAAEGRRGVMVTWEPWVPGGSPEQPDFSLGKILKGRYDDYIRSWARGLAAYGKVVYLRPMHEMNGTWYPWGGTVNGNSPRRYRRTWRRLHRMFDRAGATNVRWVWSPYAEDVPADNDLERYFPGNRFVDVLALDGYNWGTSDPGFGGWRSFEELFASAYRRVAALGSQPVWIAETASAPEGGDKAQWVRDMAVTLEQRFRRIEVVVWFNTNKERDWTLTSQPEVRQAVADSLPLRSGD